MDKFLEEKKQSLLLHWKTGRTIMDDRLLAAFEATPREKFILKKDSYNAYGDYPLSIPCKQTISQPTTVMLMLQALEIAEGMNILEVGAGSGYQAALLSKMTGASGLVITIEYFRELADFAESNLKKSECTNVNVIQGDGGLGFEAEAPYDRIIVACACPSVPPPLLEQLKTGGIMVIPTKKRMYEDMQVIKKTAAGVKTESIGCFTFVPLRGKYV